MGRTVYQAVIDNVGVDPSTQTTDATWREIGVSDRDTDILLNEKLTLADADVAITIA